MAIGRISGSVLKSNLTRNGVDLAFETNLLYLDVTNSRVGIGTSEPTSTLHVNGDTTITGDLLGVTDITASGTTQTDIIKNRQQLFTTSNVMKFNQLYTGAAAGSYFTNGEYQKVVTITPSGDSQNYQVIGRITAQNAGETHVVNFNAALRSNTLPDLDWTILYDEEYNGSRYIDPQLWTKETTTAGFIFAFKTLATIYGTVTVDFDVIPRTSALLDNVSINTTQNSEQTSVDAGFTANDMTRVVRKVSSSVNVNGSVTATSFTGDGSGLTGINVSTNIQLVGDDSTGTILGTGETFKIAGGTNITTAVSGDTLTVTGPDLTSYLQNTGTQTIDNLTFNDNTIGSSSNADINITPGGTGSVVLSGITYPSADGSNGQVLQTDGAGNITFAESSGGGGGNNTAVKQFNYYKLGTTSAVVDEFDITEYRGAIYDIVMEDQDNGFVGHLKVSVVHDDSTPYVSTYNVNEDSTRIADFTVAISGDMVQLSAATNTSSHTNLRIYRVALGDHHETVANTNSKIIATSTNIGSSATTLDQFTKTDIRGAKYIILIKDDTAGDYQISETSLTHDGTTVYHDDYALVSSRGTPLHTISASISGATVTLSSASGGNTTGTAILYRQDLGSKTKLGEFDNFLYGVKGDIDSAVETVDTFDVFKYKTARYFITMESGSEYQNSEVTMTVNNAGTDATISESFVLTANNNLATFTADVSSGKARLRASCNPNTKIYFARLSMEADNIYRASGQTADDLYITHNNLKLEPGAIRLPKGTTAARPTASVTGMIRYNTTTDTYERYDTTGWTNIATQSTVSESADVSTGEQTSIGTTSVNIDTFTTGTYDSAFYLAVTKDEINDEISTAQISLMHDDTTAFVSAGGGVQSGDNPQLTYTADINAGTVRLRGSGTAAVNSIKFYKIGLGDATSASSSGNIATIINTDVDSATENLDTWAHASYRGAKYYISCNNATNGEVSNIECLVVHNGSDAFITAYNEHYSGDNSLITLTADLSGTDVRLRASCSPNTAVKMYRVLLSDSESDASSTNTKVVGQTVTSSSATTMDTFNTSSANGAHYVVVGNSTSEGAASVNEVFVVTDGADAYVSSAGISTKGTDQLSFTAALSGTTVTVSSASTSGASTTVNAYRVQLLRASAGAATSEQVLVSTTQTITGAKTFSNASFILSNLPTSDPLVAGQLWRSGNDLKISTG